MLEWSTGTKAEDTDAEAFTQPQRLGLRRRRRPYFGVVLFLGLWVAACGLAHARPDADHEAMGDQAVALFSQGRRLEALPLLEELVQANSKDDAMLVALAACLIDHAATLTNEEAASRERLRAKDLLDRARNLGNASPVALNLSQLLGQLPPNGAITFSDDPGVEHAIRAGEAAFARRDFDRALADYAKALELDPGNYTATLFTASAYDRKRDFAKAEAWYRRAIQLDSDVETAYRYWADMLAKQGDMERARALLIGAAVAEPYNPMVWRELKAWAAVNGSRINEVYIGIPAEPQKSSGARQLLSVADSVWHAYRSVRSKWQHGDEFEKRFADEKRYRHTTAEESEALRAAAEVLQRLQEDKRNAELVVNDPTLSLLLKLYQAELLEPYVLFSLGDAGIARDYAAYRARNRDKLQEYLDKFVVMRAR